MTTLPRTWGRRGVFVAFKLALEAGLATEIAAQNAANAADDDAGTGDTPLRGIQIESAPAVLRISAKGAALRGEEEVPAVRIRGLTGGELGELIADGAALSGVPVAVYVQIRSEEADEDHGLEAEEVLQLKLETWMDAIRLTLEADVTGVMGRYGIYHLNFVSQGAEWIDYRSDDHKATEMIGALVYDVLLTQGN